VVLSKDVGLSDPSTVLIGTTPGTIESVYLGGKQSDGVTWKNSGRAWDSTTARAHSIGDDVWSGKSVLEVRGSYVIYRDFEILTSDPKRAFNFKLPDGMPSAVRGYGVFASYPVRGTKLVNLVIHDNGGGVFLGVDADVEVYGCIIFNNGFNDYDRGHGLAVYAQNLGTIQKRLRNNIAFNGFTGMKAYAESQQVRNFLFEYNILFNAGVLESFPGNTSDNGAELSPNHRQSNLFVGTGNAGEPPNDIKIRNNYLYHQFDAKPEGGNLAIGYQGRNATGFELTDSRVMGGNNGVTLKHILNISAITGNTVYAQTTSLGNVFNRVMEADLETGFTGSVNGNTYMSRIPPISGFVGYVFGLAVNGIPRQACGGGAPLKFSDRCGDGQGGWKEHSLFDGKSTWINGSPRLNEVFVIPNEYERGRVHIAIYNWQLLSSVTVNVSGFLDPGDRWAFYPAEAGTFPMGTPFQTGTVTGSSVSIRTSGWSVAAPIGFGWTPGSVAPEFFAGVIKRIP
jgi:hypothetical protein